MIVDVQPTQGDPDAPGLDEPADGLGDGPTASSPVWFAILAAVLAGAAPLLFVSSSARAPGVDNAWLWAVVLIIGVGLRMAWLIAFSPRRIFEIVFWLFTYTFMGLAPLVQVRTDTYPETTKFIDPSLNATAFAIVLIGCVAYAVGAVLGGRVTRSHPRDLVARVSPHRVTILSVVSLLIAVYYVAKIGPATLLSTRDDRSVAESAIWPNFTLSAIVRASATLPLVVCFSALMRLRRERRLVGGAGPSVLPWVILVTLFIVVNPISSPRYVVGTALLAVIAALGGTASDRRARLFMVFLAASLVFVFPYADVARNANEKGPIKVGGPAAALSTSDFDAFDQVNNTVAYVEARGHTNGRQLAGAALFWVPRVGWPNKPTNTGEALAKFREYDYENLSAAVWTELWIDGGWPLLIGGMGLLGWVLRRADERARRQPRNVRPGVLLGILPFYMIIVLRGSLLQAMAGLTVLVLSGLFVSTRSPTDQASP